MLAVRAKADAASCPSCGVASALVQARYRRCPLDLPWRGFVVRLEVTVRRFRCDNDACAHRTFAEDFGGALGRRRRFTTAARFAATLAQRAAPARRWRKTPEAVEADLIQLLEYFRQ